MPFLVEVHGLEDCLHGELTAIVSQALEKAGKKYEKIRVNHVGTDKNVVASLEAAIECCACSTFAKFWIRDGGHIKPACTYHAKRWSNDSESFVTIVRPFTEAERKGA